MRTDLPRIVQWALPCANHFFVMYTISLVCKTERWKICVIRYTSDDVNAIAEKIYTCSLYHHFFGSIIGMWIEVNISEIFQAGLTGRPELTWIAILISLASLFEKQEPAPGFRIINDEANNTPGIITQLVLQVPSAIYCWITEAY